MSRLNSGASTVGNRLVRFGLLILRPGFVSRAAAPGVGLPTVPFSSITFHYVLPLVRKIVYTGPFNTSNLCLAGVNHSRNADLRFDTPRYYVVRAVPRLGSRTRRGIPTRVCKRGLEPRQTESSRSLVPYPVGRAVLFRFYWVCIPKGVLPDLAITRRRESVGPPRRPRRGAKGQLRTMRRRKLIVGLGALASGGAAALGTGAFSQMNSGERAVTVQVEDDANSVLALVPAADSDPNHHGHFAEQNGDKLQINVDGDNLTFPNGNDVNPDSEYDIDNVFKIQNQVPNGNPGTGEVAQWISSNTAGRVDFYWGGDPSDSAEGAANSKTTSPSDEVKVGMYIDARNLDSSDAISGEIVISAEDTAI